MKIKLLLSYDGTDFEGWQRQNRGQKTIQATLEDSLSRLFDSPIAVQGSGRTDTGAHAEGQVAHFVVPEHKNLERIQLVHSLNAILPKSISVLRAWETPKDFHALHSAEQKTYRYLIYNKNVPSPLLARYSLWYRKPLDLKALTELTAPLLGTHDFKSFQTAGTEVRTTTREIYSLNWRIISESQIEFRITGSGFLKQMVRNIVGTTLYLDRNGGSAADMLQILAALNRSEARDTAPAHGLYLHSVQYPPHLDNECREL